MDLAHIRRTIIAAIASDEMLEELLVLKGGNALELVHKLGSRGSVDLDFSMEKDVGDPGLLAQRLERALRDRFDALEYELFDFTFEPRPSTSRPGVRWGGYRAEFKLIAREEKRRLGGRAEAMRRQAEVSGPDSTRRFRIEISKYEFCGGSVKADVDGWEVRVYTPAMIAVEKFRALCQQMEEYELRKNPTPRARDFYDIHAVVTKAGVDLTRETDLLREVFAAKAVLLTLLRNLESYREFHRQDWPKVRNAVSGELFDFDYYFNFALGQVRMLDALGVIDAPAP